MTRHTNIINDPTPAPPCQGILGKLLGHKYAARFEVIKQSSPHSRDMMMRAITRLTDVGTPLASHERVRSIEAVADTIQGAEQFLTHEICIRCGHVIVIELGIEDDDDEEEEEPDES